MREMREGICQWLQFETTPQYPQFFQETEVVQMTVLRTGKQELPLPKQFTEASPGGP
jgi:hypothetical protein